MKCLIIDNYDSFTYNIVQLVRYITGGEPDVKRNDRFGLDELEVYDKILLSPGPGVPADAGRLLDVIRHFGPSKSILGVCLGHQAIGQVYGAQLVRMSEMRHGVALRLKRCLDDRILQGLPTDIEAGLYHSWVLSHEHFPPALKILLEDEAGNIMAVRHREYDVCGVQFHPESILTPQGAQIITNWINSKS